MIIQSLKLLFPIAFVMIIGGCNQPSTMPSAQLLVEPLQITLKRNQSVQVQLKLDDPYKIFKDTDIELAFVDGITGISIQFQEPTIRNQNTVIATVFVNSDVDLNRKYGLKLGGKINGGYKVGTLLGLTIEP
jgi:hypothetical protein